MPGSYKLKLLKTFFTFIFAMLGCTLLLVPGNRLHRPLAPAAAAPAGRLITATVSATITVIPTPTLTMTVVTATPSPTKTAALTATVVATPSPAPTLTPFATITITAAATPAAVLISEVVYDGTYPSTEGDEFVELCNSGPGPIDLTGYKVGDEETPGSGEGMYQLPLSTTLAVEACLVVAKNADQFFARFGRLPDFEVISSGSKYTDNPAVANLSKYTAWARGSWALSNAGDELLLLDRNDNIVDSVAYRNGDYDTLGLEAEASAAEPDSLQRVWPVDTGSMPHDFLNSGPNPNLPTRPPPPPASAPPPAALPGGMQAYWGDLHAHTTYSDGAGPPHYALAKARAAGLHFYTISDHGWWLSSVEWANTLSQTIEATVPGEFVALRAVEWSHQTSGHINVFNGDTLLRRTDPQFDTLAEIYDWLAANPNVMAQFNHPDPSFDGTFDDFAYHPEAAPRIFLQEIGNHAQGYVTYEGSFIQSNMVGWRVAPVNASDSHTANWGTDTFARTGIVAAALTEADLLEGMRSRRVFATEDSNLAVTLRANGRWMGTVLTSTGLLTLTVDVVDADAEPFTLFLYDVNQLIATQPFPTSAGAEQWQTALEIRPGHYVWAKVVQADGNTAYSAPIWAEGKLTPEKVYINEIMPAPKDVDWDGDGEANAGDEWIELFNPGDRPLALGGWRLTDTSRVVFDVPLDFVIPARDFVTLYHNQLGFSLNNGGDTVTLTYPGGDVVDRFTYDRSPGFDETWCRLPDGDLNWSDNCGPSPNEPNWEKILSKGPLKVNIYEAKRLTYNAWVKVKGKVTVPPGVLGRRTMYIQDGSAGILIYLPKDHRLDEVKLGDKVEVVGNLRSFYHEAEIVVDERQDAKFLNAGAPIHPLPIATTSLLEPYEGMLVMLQGQAVHFKGRTRIWLDDGTGWAQTYISRSTGIKRPFIEVGTPVTAIGVVSQRSTDQPSRNDYRLLLRYPSDLVLPPPPPPPTDWPVFLPDTGQQRRQ